jgi:hypothetical protein
MNKVCFKKFTPIDMLQSILFHVAFLLHVFRPAGWDNEKKIAILYDGMTSMRPDDAYNDVIMKPVVRKVCIMAHFSCRYVT